MTARDVEALAREMLARREDASDETLEYAPAKSGFITTIFYRLLNGEPAGIAYTTCGDADQQNADAAYIVHGWNHGPAIARALLDARAENEALRKDAERYRFLRNQEVENDFPRHSPFIGLVPDNLVLTEEDADRHVDEAMAALHPSEEKKREI